MKDLQRFIKYGKCYLKNNLNTSNNFRNNYRYDHQDFGNLTQIVVVGCGGTGGRIIPLLAQHISNHNKTIDTVPNNTLHLKHKIGLTLVDFDSVEQKNLTRQNFIQTDVGRNKAEIFAERYSCMYGIDIKYYTEIFSKNIFKNDTDLINYIIFDCTDNLKARKSIEDYVKIDGNKNRVIISCGNESDFGQIFISQFQNGFPYNSATSSNKDYITEFRTIKKEIIKENPKNEIPIFNFPSLLDVFKDFKDSEKPSCTDIQLIDEQSMPINSLVAQLAYNAFYLLVAGQNLNYYMVKCNIVNKFTTSTVSYPLDVLDIFAKAICGESNEITMKLIDDISSCNYADTQKIINLLTNNDKKHCVYLYKKYVMDNYCISEKVPFETFYANI